MKRLRIGISSCLLGDEVRFDGGHKRDSFLADVLGPFVEWVRVCPEVEIGLGVPRETLRLVQIGGDTRMMTTRTGIDHTDRMRAWAERKTKALAALDLRGYVLKQDSPSCGMEHVKVFSNGASTRNGVGTYAEVLKKRLPSLPIEEEGRLSDPVLRENFIERIFACDRLRALFGGRWTVKGLMAFHRANEMALLAHSREACEQLGRLAAAGAAMPRAELQREYEALFMRTMARPATPERHASVLMHMADQLETSLDDASRSELRERIDQYRRGLLPLVVPLTLLRHHVRVHPIESLAGQTYLEPHPPELMLRNHV